MEKLNFQEQNKLLVIVCVRACVRVCACVVVSCPGECKESHCLCTWLVFVASCVLRLCTFITFQLHLHVKLSYLFLLSSYVCCIHNQ